MISMMSTEYNLNKSKFAICLAGMHRSGTSLTASWLSSCGLPLYLNQTWGASPGNPKGHFEDVDFTNVAEAFLVMKGILDKRESEWSPCVIQ